MVALEFELCQDISELVDDDSARGDNNRIDDVLIFVIVPVKGCIRFVIHNKYVSYPICIDL